MAESAPISRQPLNSDQERLDPEPGYEETKRKKRNKWWQRICQPFNHCAQNFRDCLDFWCCQNECRNFCYDFCCKFDDDDLDCDTDPVCRNEDIYIDQASMTVLSEQRKEENYPLNIQNSDIESGISGKYLGAHNGVHQSENNHGGHSETYSGGHDGSENLCGADSGGGGGGDSGGHLLDIQNSDMESGICGNHLRAHNGVHQSENNHGGHSETYSGGNDGSENLCGADSGGGGGGDSGGGDSGGGGGGDSGGGDCGGGDCGGGDSGGGGGGDCGGD